MKKVHLWLWLFILIAFGLRLTLLGEQSLWYDEGVTWMLSQMRTLSDLIEWTAADIQPPLYYLLIWGTDLVFGHSEWALRFPSVFFNTLTLPLIYVIGRRLFANLPLNRTVASRLATGVFAISPLMVYYSQEARMYTLLVFEITLASYLLLRLLHPKRPTKRQRSSSIFNPLVIGYIFVAAAALYTHYFAAFLLVAHGLYSGFVLWQRDWPKTHLLRTASIFGLTVLLFIPWLPTLFSRLGDDPSYWPGALKLNEAVRKVLISFTVGETIFEQIGFRLALIYIGLLILAAGFWIANYLFKEKTRVSKRTSTINVTIFLLLWLLLPPALILLLSYQSPKFNPRYTLLAWPAFCLLLSAVLVGLLPRQTHQETAQQATFTLLPSRRTFRPSHLILSLTLIFVLATSTFSLYNWFTDPRFSKDDFQALAQFVRERIGPEETVLLSSGHLFPVWAYYYGWENWTPLPWLQRLDVSRVTDLSISTEIAEAVEGKTGVWLVTWQDEVIDPNGVVPFWLDLIGERPKDAGDFWGVGLEHWRLDPDRLDLLNESPIKRIARFDPSRGLTTSPAVSSEELSSAGSGFNFANRVDLLGMTQLSDTEIALFWRPRQSLPDNLLLTLDLTDQEGFDWDREDSIGRPGAYLYPPSRWPVGEIVMTRHRLNWQIGTPPGLYTAEIGLGEVEKTDSGPQAARAATGFVGWDVLDEQGRPYRRTALLELVNLSHLVEPERGPLPMDDDPVVDFFPIVGVRRVILPQTTASPGDRLLLALLWQAGEYNLDDISVAFDLVDADGQSFRVGSSVTPSRRFNLPSWEPGDVVLGQYWLDIPPEAGPGPATLQLHLIHQGAFPYDELFTIGELEILPTQRNFRPPDSVEMPLEADFSGQATLIGADCQAADDSACRASPGESVTLTFYWRAKGSFDENYTVFTHLLDSNQAVLVNADHAPPKPTQGWVEGEIIVDPVRLTLPADLPPGDYLVEVGLYNAADPGFERLPLSSGETRVILPQPLMVE